MAGFSHLTLRLIELPTRTGLAAAHASAAASVRQLTILGLHADGDLATTVGWGECAALNTVGYTSEWAEGCFEQLRRGAPLNAASFPMAAAALEMAVLDAELKSAGQSLAVRLGSAGQRAPAGAVVGLEPLPTVLRQIEELVELGYRRIKLKIAPGRVATPVRAVRSSFPDLELQVDANGSLDEHDLTTLLALRDLGVRVVEQPFAVGRNGLAARLVDRSDMAIAADEALTSPADVHELAADRAATAVVVKPSRLGGLRQALAVVDEAQVAGMHCIVGGMLESGLGRHLLAALAPLPAFSLCGDLSPAWRWLLHDPFPDLDLRQGEIEAPARLGIAGEPDLEMLERFTVRRALVAWPHGWNARSAAI